MSPPALIVLEDGFIRKSCDNEWQGFSIFPGENTNNPNPKFNFVVKKAALQNQNLSRPSVKEESFRMVLPLEMSPPRDRAVPLPVLPEPLMKPRKKISHQEHPEKNHYHEEEDFKCNAFCLYLPGFGKQKPVRSPKSEDPVKRKMMKTSPFSNSTSSFEKFECGSWASTTVLAQENSRLYFDLPVEMIKCGGRDRQEPVNLGSFFDKETGGLALRSVLKTRSSWSGREQRSSAETSPQRRVRFSTTTSVSCPTSPRSCITPRLLKARDDFNTFLAAQNA